MDSPVFKLERVVHNREGLEDFEGPLDLILFLLSKNKIEIQDIPIALILDQYLAYLERRQQLDLEIASEFVAMAAQLMFIKTRMLLSLEDEEAQSEINLLIQSLEARRSSEIYGSVRAAAALLEPMGEFGRNILVRNPEGPAPDKIFEYDHSREDLLAAIWAIADRNERRIPPPLSSFSEIVRQEPYPVSSKAADILSLIKEGISSFRLLFRGSRSRSEVVATFLAVLELCRARIICLTGGAEDCAVAATGESMEGLHL